MKVDLKIKRNVVRYYIKHQKHMDNISKRYSKRKNKITLFGMICFVFTLLVTTLFVTPQQAIYPDPMFIHPTSLVVPFIFFLGTWFFVERTIIEEKEKKKEYFDMLEPEFRMYFNELSEFPMDSLLWMLNYKVSDENSNVEVEVLDYNKDLRKIRIL